MKPSLTLNYGLRYDYYVPLTEVDNRISKFNIDTGTLDPNTTPFYRSKKNNFQPRIGATLSPTDKTVIRGGFGLFVGPGQTEDQIQPIEADRIVGTVSSGALNTYPFDAATFVSNFTTNPNNRNYQPRAYSNEYTLPEKIYQYPLRSPRSSRADSGRLWRMSAHRDAISSCAPSRTRPSASSS